MCCCKSIGRDLRDTINVNRAPCRAPSSESRRKLHLGLSPFRFLRGSALVALVAAGIAGSIGLLGAFSARAAVIDWSGTAATTAWATGSNWIGGTPPTNDLITDVARFDQTAYVTQPNAGSTSVSGIQIGDGTTITGPLTIATTALSLGSSGVSMYANAGPATINGTVKLGASQTWSNASTVGSALTIAAAVTNAGNATPYALTLNASGLGGITLSGLVSNGGTTGTTAIVVNTAGGTAGETVTFSNNGNSFTGGFTVLSGAAVGNDGAATSGTKSYFGKGTIYVGDTASDANNALLTVICNYVGSYATTTTIAQPITVNPGTTGTIAIVGNGNYNSNGNNSVPIFSGAITLNNALTLADPTAQNTAQFSGVITGSSNITIGCATLAGAGNAGTVDMTGANASAFTGNLIVESGTLKLDASAGGALNSGSALTMGGAGDGTFNYTSGTAGTSQTLGALTFNGGDATVQCTGGTLGSSVLTFASLATRTSGVGATGNFVVSGGTTGSGGNNNIVLTSPPTAGTLIDPGIFFGGSAYATYDTNGFLRAYGSSDTGYATATGANAIVNSSTSNVTLSGGVTAQNSATVNTLTVATYGVGIGSGQTLSLNSILKAGNNAGGTISGGTLQPATNGGDLIVRTDRGGDTLTISSTIAPNGVNSLVKSGAGTLTLSGANNLTGGLFLNGGTFSLSSTSSLGASGAPVTFNGATLAISTGATLNLTSRPITVNAAGGTISAPNASNDTVIMSSITGNGSLNFSTHDGGVINATLSGTNSGFSGAISTVSTAGNPAFSLELDGANAGGTGAINYATETVNYHLTLKNDSSATFSNSSVNMGGNNAQPLVIDVDKLDSGGSTGQTLTLSSVNMGNGAGGSSISATSSSSSDILGITTLTFNDTNGGRSFAVNATSASFAIGTFNFGTDPLSLSAGNATLGGTIGVITGSPALTVSSGTWAFTGPSTYTTATTISGGTLSVSADNNLGAVPGSATTNKIVVGGTGANTATLSANASFTLNSKRGIGLGSTTTSTTGSGTLDVAAGQTLTYNGIIANAGATSVDSLVKTSGGTLALGGNNTYSGTTSVNGGGLLLNSGTLSSGPVFVNNASILGGTGTINGPVNVNNSAVLTGALTIGGATALTGSASLNPGSANGTGALTVNNSLSFGASTTSNFYIGGTTLISGSNYTINGNQVLGASSLTYGGSLNVALAAGLSATSIFASGNTYTFQLFPSGASVSGAFANAGTLAATLNATYNLSSIDEKWNGFLNGAIQVVPYTPPTTPSYTLALSPTAANAHTSATVGLVATINNIGGGSNPDSFDYSGLTVIGGAGGTITGPTSGGTGATIAAGGFGTTSGLTYSNSTAGVYTLTTTVGSVIGDNGTTPTISPPAGSVTLQLYTGQSTWLGGSSARWGDYGNWDGAGGAPGVYSSNPIGDSATFGTTTSGTTTVNLDSATNPSLTTLNFSSTTSSYLIGQGVSGGTLTMNNGVGVAAINVTGNHGISAPMVLASSTSVTTNTSTDTLVISGVIGDGGSGSALGIAGPGLVTLSGNNTYLGGTSIASSATLQIGSGGASGSVSSGAVTNNGTLLLNRSDAGSTSPAFRC